MIQILIQSEFKHDPMTNTREINGDIILINSVIILSVRLHKIRYFGQCPRPKLV